MHPLKAFKIPNSTSQQNLKVDKNNIVFTTNNCDINNTKNEILSKNKSTSLFNKAIKPLNQSSQMHNLSNTINGTNNFRKSK